MTKKYLFIFGSLVFLMVFVGCEMDPEPIQLETPSRPGVSWWSERGTYRAQWEYVPNASRYLLEWSTSSNFSTFSTAITTDTIYWFSEDDFYDAPATYYFRVQAGGTGNYKNSEFSPSYSRRITYE
jgi:hypothetical protein